MKFFWLVADVLVRLIMPDKVEAKIKKLSPPIQWCIRIAVFLVELSLVVFLFHLIVDIPLKLLGIDPRGIVIY